MKTKSRPSRALAAACLLLLGACGAEESSTFFQAQNADAVQGKVKVLIVGNSITKHAPSKEKGWANNNGMAASDPAHDYAHLFLAKAHVPMDATHIRNMYPFETDSESAPRIARQVAVAAPAADVAIIQLGDNVKFFKPWQLWAFDDNLTILLKELKTVRSVYCLSTFWGSSIVDRVIKNRCEKAGAKYVYIGDIYDDPANTDVKQRDFENEGVDRHPKNYAMRAIADRLIQAGASASFLRRRT